MNASSSVAVFWDYENCALPATEPSYMIVNSIRRLAHQYGSVKSFKAYLEYPEQTTLKSMALRSELQSCGVSLIDCPHNGRKDVADKMMMIDMMAYAIDNPAPATIILISGDRDFVYAVSTLALRQYKIVLLAPRSAHAGLKGQADVVYNWPDDFLPALPAVALSATAPPPPSGQERRSSRPNLLASLMYPGNPPPPPPSTTIPDQFLSEAVGSPTRNFAMNVDNSPAGSPAGGATDVNLECPPGPTAASATEPERARDITPVPVSAQTPNAAPTLLAEDGEIVQPNDPGATMEELHQPQRLHPGPSPVSAAATLPSRPPGFLPWASSSTETTPFSSASTLASGSSTLFGSSGSFSNLSPYASSFAYATAAATSSTSTLPTKPWPPTAGGSWDLPSKPQPAPIAVNHIVDADAHEADRTAWQTATFSRAAAKKRAPHVPDEFRPLVKVLKRQLAAGVPRVESSQLGTLLSAEAAPVAVLYQRAGVERLREYTALAADVGVVTLSSTSADGHNYVALHPVHRRKAVEHVWG